MVLTVRYVDSGRVAGELIQDCDVTLTRRFCGVDTVTLTGAAYDLKPLLDPENGLDGVTVEDPDLPAPFLGVKSSIRAARDGVTVVCESHLVWAWGRMCYPTPSRAWTSQDVDYADAQTGPAETVALHYIDANMGPGAQVSRRLSGLTVPTTLGRGGTITVEARSDVVGRVIADIGQDAGLDFDIVKDGSGLAVVVAAPPDMSTTARYGTGTVGGLGLVDDDWSWEWERPTGTVALVAGGNVGTARVNRTVTDSAILAAHGYSEQFVDHRQATTAATLDRAGTLAVYEAGLTPVTVTATLTDGPDSPRLGVDIPLGATIGVDLDDLPPVTQRVQEITTTWTREGVTTVGKVSSRPALTRRAQEQTLIAKRLRKLEAAL